MRISPHPLTFAGIELSRVTMYSRGAHEILPDVWNIKVLPGNTLGIGDDEVVFFHTTHDTRPDGKYDRGFERLGRFTEAEAITRQLDESLERHPNLPRDVFGVSRPLPARLKENLTAILARIRTEGKVSASYCDSFQYQVDQANSVFDAVRGYPADPMRPVSSIPQYRSWRLSLHQPTAEE